METPGPARSVAGCRHRLPGHEPRGTGASSRKGAKALQLAIDFAGVEHIIAGSDYPHQIGSLEKMVKSIEALEISEGAKGRILAGHTKELLEL